MKRLTEGEEYNSGIVVQIRCTEPQFCSRRTIREHKCVIERSMTRDGTRGIADDRTWVRGKMIKMEEQ